MHLCCEDYKSTFSSFPFFKNTSLKRIQSTDTFHARISVFSFFSQNRRSKILSFIMKINKKNHLDMLFFWKVLCFRRYYQHISNCGQWCFCVYVFDIFLAFLCILFSLPFIFIPLSENFHLILSVILIEKFSFSLLRIQQKKTWLRSFLDLLNCFHNLYHK